MRSVCLPGNRRQPKATDPDDVTRASSWSRERIDAAVLKLITVQPLAKWEIREQLAINEYAIGQSLQRLKKQKRVRRIGLRRQARWCLFEYIESAAPRKPLFNGGGRPQKISIAPKPTAPATSWWTKHAAGPREGFQEAAAARFPKPVESRELQS